MPDYFQVLNYIKAQMELGSDEIFFDEPWSPALLKKQTKNETLKPAIAQKSQTYVPQKEFRTSSRVEIVANTEVKVQSAPLDLSLLHIPKQEVSYAFLKAPTLESFYDSLKEHPVYKDVSVVAGQGTLKPVVLLVFDFYHPADFLNGNFFDSPVGQMLLRMFAALSIAKEQIFITYIDKRLSGAKSSPLLDSAFRQMLAKEISFIEPEFLVTFGELALRQIFGRDKSLYSFAGSPVQFQNIKSVALHDARAMLEQVQLKKETWNIHLPKCGYFHKK